MSHEYLKAKVSGGQAGLGLGAGFLTTDSPQSSGWGGDALGDQRGPETPGPMRRETIQRSPRPHPQYGAQCTDGETETQRGQWGFLKAPEPGCHRAGTRVSRETSAFAPSSALE